MLSICAQVVSASADKPNIVLIPADEWRWGDLSCHRHPWLPPPHLDRLAAEGTDFQQFIVLWPGHTNAGTTNDKTQCISIGDRGSGSGSGKSRGKNHMKRWAFPVS